MADERKSTAPKPFVFVLMPFEQTFKDIYTYGIKGAAEDVGAYAERLDEQDFREGMLERIFNQINKADVIVADMTGRNSNVFYEVGYAHALDKIVLLLTKDANDIPFDLKHRHHIVYEGKIEKLRKQLAERLVWAIAESKRTGTKDVPERILVAYQGADIPEITLGGETPGFNLWINERNFFFPLQVRNGGPELVYVSQAYLFTPKDIPISPTCPGGTEQTLSVMPATSEDSQDGLTQQYDLQQYRSDITYAVANLEPRAVKQIQLSFLIHKDIELQFIRLRLRLHSPNKSRFYEYPFSLRISIGPELSSRLGLSSSPQ